jgi:hypothetical protein
MEDSPMLRFTTAFLALVAFTSTPVAAQAHRQPTPATVPPNAGSSASTPSGTERTQAEMDKANKEREAKQRAWDKKMKGTMGGLCRGC